MCRIFLSKDAAIASSGFAAASLYVAMSDDLEEQESANAIMTAAITEVFLYRPDDGKSVAASFANQWKWTRDTLTERIAVASNQDPSAQNLMLLDKSTVALASKKTRLHDDGSFIVSKGKDGRYTRAHRALDAFVKSKRDIANIPNLSGCLLYTSDAADE